MIRLLDKGALSGLYLRGFGVRVEDTVLVMAEGNRVLTTFPRGLTYSDVTGG